MSTALNLKLPPKCERVYDVVKKYPEKFHPASSGYKPQINDICLYPGYDEYGILVKVPTSTGDCLIKLPSGDTIRVNIRTAQFEGYLSL